MTKRDMTDREFYAALKRNGFKKPVLFWVEHEELPNHSFSMLFRRGGKLAKRVTISHLIRRRDEELAKKAKSFPQAVAA